MGLTELPCIIQRPCFSPVAFFYWSSAAEPLICLKIYFEIRMNLPYTELDCGSTWGGFIYHYHHQLSKIVEYDFSQQGYQRINPESFACKPSSMHSATEIWPFSKTKGNVLSSRVESDAAEECKTRFPMDS